MKVGSSSPEIHTKHSNQLVQDSFLSKCQNILRIMKNYDAESETEIKTLDYQLKKLEQIETEMINMSKSSEKKASKDRKA